MPTAISRFSCLSVCYLVKHGDEYLLWDTAHAMTTPNVGAEGQHRGSTRPVEREARRDQVRRHPATTMATISGRSGRFPQATLLIGKGDWDGIRHANPAGRA
jgi:hypothetical protein